VSYRQGDFSSHEAPDARIARLASGHHGVFSYTDAIRAGFTKRTIYGRISTNRWERLHAGVYRLNGAPSSWRQQLFAACLALGRGAVASHRAAAALWHLAGYDPGILEVSVPRGRRPRERGVLVHQVVLLPVDVTAVEVIPITTPARTLLDLAAVSPADAVEDALDDALRRGLVKLPRLRWRAEELGPRSGAKVIRRLLDARTATVGSPQSVLETRLLRLLRRAGLPTPECQHEIRDHGRLIAVVDFAYTEERLAIEADGYRWHSGRARWQHDLARRNELTKLGWRVIHVTAHDIVRRPDSTVQTVAAALRLA
jgi:very-short-patch-repair endonuclease